MSYPKEKPLHYISITVLSFYLLPLLSEVAAQLNRIMNLVFTQAKNPESSFRDNKEYNCTDNQVRHVGV